MNLQEKTVSILREAANAIEARANEYQGEGNMFRVIAGIARERTTKTYSADDVFEILISTKLARLSFNEKHHDSLVDLVAYSALQACNAHPEA